MATNNFKPFGTGNSANVISQADYEALAALVAGFSSGKASSAQINKALRQGTVMASVLGQFIANAGAVDVLDNGDTATLLTNFLAALKANSAEIFLQTENKLSEIATAGAASQGIARNNLLAAALAGSATQTFSVAPATASNEAPQISQTMGKNRLINPRFIANQRSYASGSSLALNAYCFDCWKASTASSSMTFTAAISGQQVTIAGSFLQIVLAYDIEPGTYTLSWAGTAQARVYNVGGSAPAYASSPITVAIGGGVNVNVEFNTGTLFTPQLESGSVATTPERRLYQQEFALCQQRLFALNLAGSQAVYGGAGTYISLAAYAPVSLRTNPSIILGSTSMTVNQPGVGTASTTTATPTAVAATSNMIAFNIAGNWSGLSNGAPVTISAATGITLFSSEP